MPLTHSSRCSQLTKKRTGQQQKGPLSGGIRPVQNRPILDVRHHSDEPCVGVLTIGKPSDCQIIRDGQSVHKRGSRVRMEESRVLLFALLLQLPVPAVHGVISSEPGTEIVMDFVDGESLEEAWPAITAEQKHSIAVQVGLLVTSMRQAKPHRRKIGAFEGPARDCRQFSDYFGGPFENETDFDRHCLDLLRGTPSQIRKPLPETLSSEHRIVLTNADLTPRNIFVKEGRAQTLLNWEHAGWYPEYWEYVKFFDRPTGCKD